MKTPEQYATEAEELLVAFEGDTPNWVRSSEDMAVWQGGLLAGAQVFATLALASAQESIWNELRNSAALA